MSMTTPSLTFGGISAPSHTMLISAALHVPVNVPVGPAEACPLLVMTIGLSTPSPCVASLPAKNPGTVRVSPFDVVAAHTKVSLAPLLDIDVLAVDVLADDNDALVPPSMGVPVVMQPL